MDQKGHGQISLKLKGGKWNSKEKPAYKGINNNTDLIEYVPIKIVKKEVRKKQNILIMLSIVFILNLFQSQMQYKIKIIIKNQKLIALQRIYQNILVQTKMLFLIKSVIHITLQHHILRIQLFFKEVNRV